MSLSRNFNSRLGGHGLVSRNARIDPLMRVADAEEGADIDRAQVANGI
jgi:hypothetical protein